MCVIDLKHFPEMTWRQKPSRYSAGGSGATLYAPLAEQSILEFLAFLKGSLMQGIG